MACLEELFVFIEKVFEIKSAQTQLSNTMIETTNEGKYKK